MLVVVVVGFSNDKGPQFPVTFIETIANHGKIVEIFVNVHEVPVKITEPTRIQV